MDGKSFFFDFAPFVSDFGFWTRKYFEKKPCENLLYVPEIFQYSDNTSKGSAYCLWSKSQVFE